MFENLDETLENCQAFVCNSAVTVGLNPQVKFGTVIAHTHQGGAVASDLFQALQRIGRAPGLLSNTTITMMVHDKSSVQKEAEAASKVLSLSP
jgi:hypothetical protein